MYAQATIAFELYVVLRKQCADIGETRLILREGPFKSIIYLYINKCPTESGGGGCRRYYPLPDLLDASKTTTDIDAKLLVPYSASI